MLLSGCHQRPFAPNSPSSAPPALRAASSAAAVRAAPVAVVAASSAPWGVTPEDTYTQARKKLIAAGFSPATVAQSGEIIDQDMVKAYPEVTQCTSAGTAICQFVLRGPGANAYLFIQAQGEGDDTDPGSNMQVTTLQRATLATPATAAGIDPDAVKTTGPNLLPSQPSGNGK